MAKGSVLQVMDENSGFVLIGEVLVNVSGQWVASEDSGSSAFWDM